MFTGEDGSGQLALVCLAENKADGGPHRTARSTIPWNPCNHRNDEVRSVSDQRVDAVPHQPPRVVYAIDRPYLDSKARAVSDLDEASRHDQRVPR